MCWEQRVAEFSLARLACVGDQQSEPDSHHPVPHCIVYFKCYVWAETQAALNEYVFRTKPRRDQLVGRDLGIIHTRSRLWMIGHATFYDCVT